MSYSLQLPKTSKRTSMSLVAHHGGSGAAFKFLVGITMANGYIVPTFVGRVWEVNSTPYIKHVTDVALE